MAEKTLRVRYLGDARGLSSTVGAIDRQHAALGKRLTNLGNGMSSVGRKLTLGVTLPMVAMGKVALDEFGEVRRVVGQTEAAIKSTGGAANVTADHVAKLSDRLGKLAAVDGEVVQEGLNVLLTFKKVRNEVGAGNAVFDRAGLAASNMAARLKTDLSSAMLTVGKALEDPIRGVTALRRAGVQLTDQQTDQIKKFVESGRVMDAQKIILAELETQFGGSAEAMGKAASPLTKLNLKFRDLAEKAGPIVVRILERVTDTVERAVDWFERLSPAQQAVIGKLVLLTAAAGPVLRIFGPMVSLFGRHVAVTKAVTAATTASAAAQRAAAAATTANAAATRGAAAAAAGAGSKMKGLAGGLTGLLSPMNLVVAGAVLVTAAIIDARAQAEQFRVHTVALGDALVAGRTSIADYTAEMHRQIDAMDNAAMRQVWYEKVAEASTTATKSAQGEVAAYRAQVVGLIGPLSDAARSTVEAYLRNGQYSAALARLRQELQAATAQLKGHKQEFEKTTRKVDGTKLSVDRYTGALKGIPSKVITAIEAKTATASSQLRTLINQLAQLSGVHTVAVNVATGGAAGHGGQLPLAKGAVIAGAKGFVIPRRQPTYLVGEAGPETVLPLNRRGGDFMRRHLGLGGGGGTTVQVNVAGSVITERELVEIVRRELARAASRNGGFALGVA